MSSPKTGADLQHFVCAVLWMRSGISNFSSIIRPLADLLEKFYTVVSQQTRLPAGRVSLEAVRWNKEHTMPSALPNAVLRIKSLWHMLTQENVLAFPRMPQTTFGRAS